MLQSLSKFLSPTRGRIVFDGRDITALKPAEAARLGLVRSFQISAVFPHLTVLENARIVGAFLIVALQNYLASFGQWVLVIQGAAFVFCVLVFRRGIVGEPAGALRVEL